MVFIIRLYLDFCDALCLFKNVLDNIQTEMYHVNV